MRAIFGIIVIIAFIVRMIYRLTVTRDLRQEPDELYIGLFFIAAWLMIYLYIYCS